MDNSLDKLTLALNSTDDVYVGAGVDKTSYFAAIAKDICDHICEPFEVIGLVKPPAFADAATGSVISGQRFARNAGNWLVYQPSRGRFLCFWGEDAEHLTAPGITGSPMYCWTT